MQSGSNLRSPLGWGLMLVRAESSSEDLTEARNPLPHDSLPHGQRVQAGASSPHRDLLTTRQLVPYSDDSGEKG